MFTEPKGLWWDQEGPLHRPKRAGRQVAGPRAHGGLSPLPPGDPPELLGTAPLTLPSRQPHQCPSPSSVMVPSPATRERGVEPRSGHQNFPTTTKPPRALLPVSQPLLGAAGWNDGEVSVPSAAPPLPTGSP